MPLAYVPYTPSAHEGFLGPHPKAELRSSGLGEVAWIPFSLAC